MPQSSMIALGTTLPAFALADSGSTGCPHRDRAEAESSGRLRFARLMARRLR
jgi:hypothetical protein